MCGTLTLEFPINRAVIIVHLRKVLFHTWNGQFDWEKKTTCYRRIIGVKHMPSYSPPRPLPSHTSHTVPLVPGSHDELPTQEKTA